MSDALTDIARDQRRGRHYTGFLGLLEEYLKKPKEDKLLLKKVVKAADETDSVPRGYWGGRTSLSEGVSKKAKKLRQQDKETWTGFLAQLAENDSWGTRFQTFKNLSPFKGKLVIYVDYGYGFVSFYGDYEHFISGLIGERKGWRTYNADNYLVVFPEPSTDAEVFWISGPHGETGPQPAK